MLITQDMIEKLLDYSGSTGRMIREGIKVAIVGKPNVGKSSLDEWSFKGNTRYRDGYSRYDT